jgi:polar amino acid transport system substrate-binding protein
MYKATIGCLAAVLLGLGRLAAADTTITLANGDWPPYMGKNLPHAGSVSRIVSEAFATEGVKVKFEFMPWARGLEEAKAGHLDGTFVWSKTPERETIFYLTEPVFIEKVYLLYPKAKPLHFNQLSDLSKASLGATIGYNYGPEWNRLEQSKGLQVSRVPSDEQNLQKLLGGRVDAFPIDLTVGMYMLNQIGGAAAMDKVGYDAAKPLQQEAMYMLISRQAANGAELVRKFNAGLAKLKASGKLEQYLKEGITAK